MNNNLIPIIEPEKDGYWEIYPDRKIWHNNLMKFKDLKEVTTKYNMGGDWMKLETGDNKIRIVSEFGDYGNHYDQARKRSTICIGKEHCAFCQEGDKPRVQFLGWIIDRKDNKIKLLRIGYKIFQQISALATSDEYAFDTVPDYDVTITKSGQGLETEYSVLPARSNTELTQEEQEAITQKIKPISDILDTMKAKIALPDGSEGSEDLSPED